MKIKLFLIILILITIFFIFNCNSEQIDNLENLSCRNFTIINNYYYPDDTLNNFAPNTSNLNNVEQSIPTTNPWDMHPLIGIILLGIALIMAVYLFVSFMIEIRKQSLSKENFSILIVMIALIILTILDINGYFNSIPFHSNLPNWLLVIATFFLFYVTYENVKLVHQQIEFQTEPKIHAILETNTLDRTFIDLVIENIGNGPANDVKFDINPDFETISGSLKNNYDIFQRGKSYFPPHHRIPFTITHLPDNYEQKRDSNHIITIRYKNGAGKEIVDKYPLDFYQFHGLRWVVDRQ